MQVFVPARYIKLAAIDYDAEALACIGVPLAVGKLAIPPVTLGVLSVLEALDCQFIPDPLSCGLDAACTAVAVSMAGRKSLHYVTDRAALSRAVRRIRRRFGAVIAGNYQKIVSHYHETPYTGFSMIKRKGRPCSDPWWFGAVAIAGLVAGAGKIAGYDADRALWDLPLTLAGHILAAKAAQIDEMAVARPNDDEDIKTQLRAAKMREIAGELHPWQVDLPDDYPLSQTQLAANPALAEQLDALKAAKKRK